MPKRRTSKLPLREQIVREEYNPYAEELDPEMREHLEAFIKDCQQSGVLEDFDISDPEQAKKALVMLKNKQIEISGKIKTAEVLKRLLESKAPLQQ